jgi:dipeptidyl-peptidase 4
MALGLSRGGRVLSLGFAIGLVAVAATLSVAAVPNQNGKPKPVTGANWRQAYKYATENLRKYVYSSSVRPVWVGKTDVFVYSFRTSKGTNYYRVDPAKKSKEPLFDHAKLAAKLSELSRKPVIDSQMTLARLSINDKGTVLKFVYEGYQYEFDLPKTALKKLGKATVPTATQRALKRLEEMRKSGRISDEQYRRFRQIYLNRTGRGRRRRPLVQSGEIPAEYLEIADAIGVGPEAGSFRLGDGSDAPQRRRRKRGGNGGRGRSSDRVYSPNRKHHVFALKHNLFVVDGDAKNVAIQVSADGVEDYSFGNNGDKKVRPRVNWSKDSNAFYVYRSDSRGVKELWLINSLSQPRPTLEKRKYSMPGEEPVRRSDLFYYNRATKKLRKVEQKWRDEEYLYPHWGKTGNELQFLRRDRLYRNIELCTLDTRTGSVRCLVPDGFEDTIVNYQSPRYLTKTDEFLWWSERSGWGHFYLYDHNGKLKNAITSGPFRAAQIVAVDEAKRQLYFYGNAREKGENVYLTHLYRVNLDGGRLTLLDPGNANHSSTLSPTKRFLVDNCSKVDKPPLSVLRDANGRQVMRLEKMDLSQLQDTGWKPPETFVVKAADGVTNLYGNMWKPFDFDPYKKYPIIAHVYPGPQQEGTTHTFNPVATEQQLAQLGFIVIQVGHRGGSPRRSKAYQRFSYFNMRDYGLADKKAAIEELAARFSFIDIRRVGIYGHSGGGFMSAAAVLQKPFNEFFTAAVASAGNHDNNIYNHAWAERYHGMKEVPVTTAAKTAKTSAKKKPESEPSEVNPYPEERRAVRAIKPKHARRQAKKTDRARTAVKAVKPRTKTAVAKTDAKMASKPRPKTKFEIHVPTNAELAANLKGHLLLVHGEIDNNVHPANTIRLVDALIKANKRFDMLILPGQRHGFGVYTPYFTQRMWEFFAAHLLNDRPRGADLYDKKEVNNQRATN